VFTLNVDNDLQDQYVVPVTFAITDGNKTLWQQTKNVTVNAPVFSIGNLLVDDATGNGDGILDPGETANLNIQVTNTGHADVSNVIGQISSMSPYLIINSSMTSPDILSVGETGIFTFNVTASIAAQDGTVADIAFDLTAGASNQYTAAQAFEIVIGFVPEYCAASGGCDEYITRVEIGTIDNSSACDGYFNYTDISTNVDLGVSYPITVTVGTPYSTDAVSAFVDWNYDGDFSDADETFDLLWNYNTAKATGNILVPEGITPRNVTIRIRLTYSEIPTSCGTTTYGEVEDYTLSIQPGITQGGTLMATYNFICIGSSTGDMTLSNNSGTITDWEKRLNNGTWASLGFTGSTYSETPSNPGIWEYRVEVDNGGAYSNNVAIQVKPEIIASFTYTAENQTISFLNTSIEATSFAWDFGDGNNSTETNPVHIYTASGNYNVTLTGSNNVCPDNIYGESIPVNFVGLDDLDANLTISPNPSNGKFILTANGLNNSILSIYSVNGQKIYETRISDDYLEVDLNTVSAGVYFIELINNEIRINKKLIIK
jgi:PKD repeat protein